MKLLRNYVRQIIAEERSSFNSLASANLKQDNFVSASRNKGVLQNEKEENDRMEQDDNALPRAACVIILSDDGKILAVSRKDNPSDFGLPGGKVDPGESDWEAASRELQEETGLMATKMRKVFVDNDSSGYRVTTFVAEVDGDIDTNESGVVRWVDPSILLRGSFKTYNTKLFKKVFGT